MRRRSLVAILLTSIAVVSSVSPARADVKADCLAAYEKAQVERKAARLTSAREQLLVCAQDACPAVVKKDCAPWLAEAEQAVPTVVLAAKDGKGKDLVDVKVFVDGFLLTTSLDGSARPLDPGNHVLRFESGSEVAEETVVLREGEKRRVVTVTIGAAQEVEAPVGQPPVTEPPPEPAPSGGSKIPAIGVGALGVVAIGAGVFIGLGAKSDADDLRSTCAPNSEQGKIDDVETKLLLSDIALGVGVVAVAAAVVLWIAASPSEPAKTAQRSSWKTGKMDGPLRFRF
jgi:hypothetical protein